MWFQSFNKNQGSECDKINFSTIKYDRKNIDLHLIFDYKARSKNIVNK